MNADTNRLLRVVRIVEGTSVDGPGLRTSVYLAGCRHRCPGCHNPQTWDPAAGRTMTIDELLAVIADNDAPLTLSGGDPLEQPDAVALLVSRVRNELGLNVWVYTGYVWEKITTSPPLRRAVEGADVVVDGPYVAAERDTTLRFRGSRNQRLIDVAASLRTGSTVLWHS